MSITRIMRRHHQGIGKKRGEPFSHIIRQFILGDRLWLLHATKGWRNESLKRKG